MREITFFFNFWWYYAQMQQSLARTINRGQYTEVTKEEQNANFFSPYIFTSSWFWNIADLLSIGGTEMVRLEINDVILDVDVTWSRQCTMSFLFLLTNCLTLHISSFRNLWQLAPILWDCLHDYSTNDKGVDKRAGKNAGWWRDNCAHFGPFFSSNRRTKCRKCHSRLQFNRYYQKSTLPTWTCWNNINISWFIP